MDIEEVQLKIIHKKGFYKAYGVDGSQCQLSSIIIDGLEVLLIGIPNLMRLMGFVKSNNEVKDIIEKGEIVVGSKTITDPELTLGMYRIGAAFEFL